MEMASSEVVAALLNVKKLPATGRCIRPKGTSRVTEGRRRRCQCGRCRECLDNARWERIFAEKFADPNYYTRITVRDQSPLSSL